MPKLQNNQPLVCFVIVCWNNRLLLAECLESIYSQTYKNFKIIIVDNGSTDGSADFVEKNYPAATVIKSKTNLKFAKGNNLGIKFAFKNYGCSYIATINTDARLDPGWTQELAAFAETVPRAACLQGITYNYANRDTVDSAGILIDHNANPIQIAWNTKQVPQAPIEVFGVNAAAAMYRRAFLETGPFGSDYFDSNLEMYLEDLDLSARALILGWTNWCVPAAKAYHIGSASSGNNSRLMLFMTHRNNGLFLIKNFPWSIVLRSIPGTLKTEIARIIHFLKRGNFSQAAAVIEGRLAGILLIPLFLKKRRELKKVWHFNKAKLIQLMIAR